MEKKKCYLQKGLNNLFGIFGETHNHNKALRFFAKSAKENNSFGLFFLIRYDEKQNEEEATSIYQKLFILFSEDTNNAWACYCLGDFYALGLGNCEINRKKALGYYQKAAESGLVYAQSDLGGIFSYSEEADYVQAFYWLNKAALAGDCRAQFQLGRHHEFGFGTENNLEIALYWYQKAAENNFYEARFVLGTFYQTGKYLIEDWDKALFWLLPVADSGMPEACNNVGIILEEKAINKKDFKKVVKYFSYAAEWGISNAQFILGSIFLSGKGINKNYEKAFFWLNEAAKKDNAEAIYLLGDCYEEGIGIEKNIYNAALNYERARHLGYLPAIHRLGCLYRFGEGVPKDYDKAIVLLESAANKDYFPSILELAYLHAELSDQDNSLKWLNKAKTLVGSQDLIQLGYAFESGLIATKDLDTARRYYLEALAFDEQDALYHLSETYADNEAELLNLLTEIYPDRLELLFKLAEIYFSDLKKVIVWHEMISYGIKKENLAKRIFSSAKALAQKKKEGYYYLGLCYEKGIGTKRNLKKANRAFDSART
ncbi:MAG: hypothetical protein FWE36_05615 [Erysipelotrichales bacterium]|nr:hypothetical protein [Erysipelotrichales bacterium]